MKKRVLCLITVIILIFTCVGCNRTDDAYLYFELPQLPTTFDPQTAETDSELIVVRNIFEGLMRIDEKGMVVPSAAESFTKNGLTYTFKIRKDAIWSNGDKVTAQDFVFGLKRALNPKTKAPFATRLYSIKNAANIHKGKMALSKLGVTAIDQETLKITLSQNDNKFLENLTTSVAMPCNEYFFNESAGKYGLFSENIISNGSYRLSKWNKEVFGIRIYKNEEYTGKFEAKNAAVFITCNNDIAVTQKLKENDIDISFIDSSQSDEMIKSGFKTANCQNICWFLTMNKDLSYSMRTALLKLVGNEVYNDSLKTGYTKATSLYPNVFKGKFSSKGITAYNLKDGTNRYTQIVKNFKDNKFPSDVKLYYFDNPVIKSIITDIVGHWQNNLSAFVNIEAVSSDVDLESQLKKQTLDMAVFPVKIDGSNYSEYLKKFGINYKDENLTQTQYKILRSKNITPLLFQNTTLCYSPAIQEIYTTNGNGFIDFSFIVKND